MALHGCDNHIRDYWNSENIHKGFWDVVLEMHGEIRWIDRKTNEEVHWTFITCGKTATHNSVKGAIKGRKAVRRPRNSYPSNSNYLKLTL